MTKKIVPKKPQTINRTGGSMKIKPHKPKTVNRTGGVLPAAAIPIALGIGLPVINRVVGKIMSKIGLGKKGKGLLRSGDVRPIHTQKKR